MALLEEEQQIEIFQARLFVIVMNKLISSIIAEAT